MRGERRDDHKRGRRGRIRVFFRVNSSMASCFTEEGGVIFFFWFHSLFHLSARWMPIDPPEPEAEQTNERRGGQHVVGGREWTSLFLGSLSRKERFFFVFSLLS